MGQRSEDCERTHGNIEDVDPDTTHVLLGANTLLGRPLECSNTRILNFVQILNALGNVDEQVGASGVRAKTPDLSGIRGVPSVVISQSPTPYFEIVAGTDLAVLDSHGEFLINRLGLEVQTVMFVLRL